MPDRADCARAVLVDFLSPNSSELGLCGNCAHSGGGAAWYVSSDGAIIKMPSGAVFRVSPGNQIDAALWSPADDVLICNDAEIIKTDENGERASVTRLR